MTRRVWRDAREFAWAPRDRSLVRVPITLADAAPLDAALAPYGPPRRYTVGGNLALIAWSDSLDMLSALSCGMGLTGQVLLGPAGTALHRRRDAERLRGTTARGDGPGRAVCLTTRAG